MTSGDLSGLDGSVSLTTYRIVQESLTNALKHGGDMATARVSITRDGDHLTVEVVNDLPTEGPGGHLTQRLTGSGAGLIGMRERSHAVGGSLQTGTRSGHWWVRAELPTTISEVPGA